VLSSVVLVGAFVSFACLIVCLGTFIATVVLFLPALVVLWCVCVIVYIATAPLFVGLYLKENHAFKASVPVAGFLLFAISVILQFLTE
jgi:hypothetical protein